MSVPKFTQGPWLTKDGQVYSESDETGATLAVVYDLRRDADGLEEAANAHLIAAAPSLYAALQEFVSLYSGHDDCRDCNVCRGRSALELATRA